MSANIENDAEELASLSIQADDTLNIRKDRLTGENDAQPTPSRRMRRSSSRFSRAPRPSAPTTGFSRFQKQCKYVFGKVFQFFKTAGENTASYFRSVFTLPMIHGHPISFTRPEDFNSTGKPKKKKDEYELEHQMDLLEAACNYNEKRKVTFQKIMADRKDFTANKKRYTKEIDWSKLAPWNESFLSHLESTFQVFDSSADQLIDFEEMSIMLTDYGDKTSPEDRLKVFAASDPTGKGALTFSEFVTMFHSITVKSPDSYPSTIVDSFRSIDRNMARIRGLDVVQQLQAGLF